MGRRELATLLLFIGLLFLFFKSVQEFSGLLLFIGFFLITPEIFSFSRYWFSGGFSLPILECRSSYCYSNNDGSGRIYVGVEIMDCRHGCYDLDEEQFWGKSSFLLDTGFIGNADYIVINSLGHYYVVLACEGRDPDETASCAAESLRSLEDSLKSVGCSWRRLSGKDILKTLRPSFLKKSGTKRRRAMVLALMAFIASKFWPLLPLVAVSILAWLDKNVGYILNDEKLEVYGLNEFTSLYTYPTYSELLGKARVIFQVSNKIYLVLRIRLAPPEIGAKLDTLAYRKYELGTALDKLSILHSSEKLFTAARRRWERRERVYLVEGALVAREEDKRVLESIGLRLGRTYSLEALS